MEQWARCYKIFWGLKNTTFGTVAFYILIKNYFLMIVIQLIIQPSKQTYMCIIFFFIAQDSKPINHFVEKRKQTKKKIEREKESVGSTQVSSKRGV